VRLTFLHGFAIGIIPLCVASFAAGRASKSASLMVVATTGPPTSAPQLPIAPSSPPPEASMPKVEPTVSSLPERVDLLRAPRCTDVTLRGVVVAEHDQGSLSLLGSGGPVTWRRRGESVGAYRLFHVGHDRAWLVRPSSADAYALCQTELGAAVLPPSPRVPSRAAPSMGEGSPLPLADLASKIERRSDTEIILDRSVVESLAENQGALASLVRAQPELEGGRTVGLQLSVVKAGSVLDKLGLRSGDRLRRAGGIELSGVEAGLMAFARIRSAEKFSLEVWRNGRLVQLDYEVR
jgi:general secretion pathway protein C